MKLKWWQGQWEKYWNKDVHTSLKAQIGSSTGETKLTWTQYVMTVHFKTIPRQKRRIWAKWQYWLLSRPQAKTKESDIRRFHHSCSFFQVQRKSRQDVRIYIIYISFITSKTALLTPFTFIITTCTALIQRDTSESRCRRPHTTKASSLHPTSGHWHPTHNRTSSPSSRNFTPSTLQNPMFSKKKGKTSLRHYALSDFHQNWLLSRPPNDLYGKHHKLTSFKTLMFCTQNGLISRPLCFWTQIDSFQDPVQWTIWKITQLTHFKTLTLDYTVF